MKTFLTSIDVLELYFYFGVKKKKEKKKKRKRPYISWYEIPLCQVDVIINAISEFQNHNK